MSPLDMRTDRDTPAWYERASEPGRSADLRPSTAGPIDDGAARGRPAPFFGAGPTLQTLRLGLDGGAFLFDGLREAGDVFNVRLRIDPKPVAVISHPDHIKSLFTHQELAPSVTGESPVRPIVGLSVLTANGAQHRRQRRLLMPAFHGDAISAYRAAIQDATKREIDQWPTGSPFALAPAAQAITLDVIMAGIFGIEGELTDAEALLRERTKWILRMSTTTVAMIGELVNIGRAEPVGILKWALARVDRAVYDVIAERRASHVPGERNDVMALLFDATDEDGNHLSDQELRNELLTLVLAGHETTANTIAWAFERLLRHPAAYDRLRDVVRSDADENDYVGATLHEAMRVRPVVPFIGRRVSVPWHFDDIEVPADSRVLVGILLTHHRADIYDDPFLFSPERFVGVKPSTSAWLPFGGGTRRCLGATLAMEEMRIVLSEIARRTDMAVTDDPPERPSHPNVTMIPRRGGRVEITATSR